MLRGTIKGLCLLSATLLSGCSYLESLSDVFSDTGFAAKPVRAIAPPYDFHVGDVYRYRVGDLFSEEKVTHVTGQEVSWADNYGRTWVTDAGTLLPPKEFHAGGTTPKAIRASMETTGPLYPLLVGKSVAFRFSRTGGGAPTSQHTQDCTVDDYGGVITTSGPYDVYKLTCRYDGVPYVNYFAPKIGRVVLQTGGSIFAGVERELVSYQSGGAADTRMAAAKPTGQMKAKPAAPHAPSKSGSSKSMPPKPHKAMAANTKKPNGFGIQLAAYKSPKRARRVEAHQTPWRQIARTHDARNRTARR
jgi:hypothetical protein